MSDRLPPVGFWSYARHDDEADQRLTRLRGLLAQQLQMQYGRERVKIFQDVAAIPPGAEWETQIRDALNHSAFFVPIITPSFVQSEWCATEVLAFREREIALEKQYPNTRGRRRIFPVHYVDIEGIEPCDPRLLPELRRLQWLDFRALIFADPSQQSVQFALSQLARSIRDLLLIPLEEAAPRAAAAPAPRTDTPPTDATPSPTARAKPSAGRAALPVPALAVGGGLIAALLLAGLLFLHPARPSATTSVTSAGAAASAATVNSAAPAQAADHPDPAAAFVGRWRIAGLGCSSPVVFSETDGALTRTFGGEFASMQRGTNPPAGVIAYTADDGARYQLRNGALSMIPADASQPITMTRCAG